MNASRALQLPPAGIEGGPPCPLALGPSLSPDVALLIERRLQLHHFKWDTQVGDRSVLLARPLLVDEGTWAWLSAVSETLARETQDAEQELLLRPELQATIGLPGPLRALLKSEETASYAKPQVRTMRFDFHFTTEGWRISEINSDVPGGFVESSVLPELFAGHLPGLRPAGSPLRAWAKAMEQAIGHGRVALLSAAGYLEDLQIVALLANELRTAGNECVLVQTPRQLSWRSGRAHLVGIRQAPPLDAVVRFYQAEWLCQLPRWTGWRRLFDPSDTLVTNPAVSVLGESKRFPLVWDRLSASTDASRQVLPRCVDPREISAGDRENWVLKGAYSNTGDEVRIGALMKDEAWRRALRIAQRNPEKWVAQRRFQTIPLMSEIGSLYPCVGVYTVNGKTAGAYARLSPHLVTDETAHETALLIS